MFKLSIMLLLFAIVFLTEAVSKNNGQWAQVSPEIQQWFKSQKVPGGNYMGQSCCDISDGVYAEEDIENGQYVVSFEIYGKQYRRMRVPDEVVIKHPNMHGRSVVWVSFLNGEAAIRCFIPGSGI